MSENYELGILNYEPNFKENTASFLNESGEAIQKLNGALIQGVYVVWNLEYNEAWLDAPVIIKTNQGQVVLAAKYLSHFSLTTDAIDMSIPINWYGDTQFEWRCLKNYEDNNFEITSANIIEFHIGPDNHMSWVFGGVKFSGKDNFIIIVNGLDCLAISFDKSFDRTRMISV